MSVLQSISDAQTAADLEMTKYLAQMSDSERMSYAGANAGVALDKVKALKNDRFSYLSEDLTGAENNVTSTAYYLTRTKDLKDMATDIDKVAVKQLSTSDINQGIVARQNEINEWANGNKLDTLFFLQILFICLTLISALYFLNSKGMVSDYLLNLCIVLVTAVAVYVLITRARYTLVRRDARYWSKHRNPKLFLPPSGAEACPGDATPAVTPPPPVTKKVCKTTTVPSTSSDTIDAAWGNFLGSS